MQNDLQHSTKVIYIIQILPLEKVPKKTPKNETKSKSSDKLLKRDYKMISVGYRIPNYLADFISSFEDSNRGLNKSDIVRLILELLYEQPWILEDYIGGKRITKDSFIELENDLSSVSSKLGQFDKKFEAFEETLNSLKSQNQLHQSIVEKLLGVSFEQLKQMPDQVLEQLYAGYLEKNTKAED